MAVVHFAESRSAYACLAELRRLSATSAWGHMRVVAGIGSAELHLPDRLYPPFRELLVRFGGHDAAPVQLDEVWQARRMAAELSVMSRRMVRRADDGLVRARQRLESAQARRELSEQRRHR